jgi:hypothetical protein
MVQRSKMKYPKIVQERIDFLNKYKENDNLNLFNIFHLYPKKIAYPNGFYDCRFFELVAFNTETMEKRNLGRHDGVDFPYGNCAISKAQVFADGAFLIQMAYLVEMFSNTQLIVFGRIK